MKHQVENALVIIMSIAISTIGVIALSGYIFNVKELHSWSHSSAMALPTTIAFIMCGWCIYLVNKNNK